MKPGNGKGTIDTIFRTIIQVFCGLPVFRNRKARTQELDQDLYCN